MGTEIDMTKELVHRWRISVDSEIEALEGNIEKKREEKYPDWESVTRWANKIEGLKKSKRLMNEVCSYSPDFCHLQEPK